MASSLCLTVMTLILLLTFVSSTLSSRTNRKEYWRDVRENVHRFHSLSVPQMDHHMMKKDLNGVLKIFFTTNDLKLGKKMPLYLLSAPTNMKFLSREEADSIAFSSSKLSNILQIFSISKGSPQAEVIESTIRNCEEKPIEGNIVFCATSLESMLDFVHSNLATSSSSSFTVLSTKMHRSPSQVAVLENYTIVEEPIEIEVSNQVGCHPFSYPYAVFYCHHTDNTKLYKVLLIGELSGEKVEAVAVCHMDTTKWDSNLVAFEVLGTKPGTEVCHFFPEGNLLWIPSQTIAT